MNDYVILIIAFRRPNELRSLIQSSSVSGRKVYVYVDFDESLSKENQEVIQIVKSLQLNGIITCLVNSKNMGVGRAVPLAISWSLETEGHVLVLEDDCELGEHALNYFSKAQAFIAGKVAIVSGRSAWAEEDKSVIHKRLTLTNLPLTNGFLVSKRSWEKISQSLVNPNLGRRFLTSTLERPRYILELSYLYSACVSNSKIAMKAWDCFIAFEMLASDLYSVNPNISTITTRGIDDVASNTKISNGEYSEYIVLASNLEPSEILDKSQNSLLITNRQISRNIYKVKIHNLFSPIKSWLKICKYKFL